MTAPDQFLSIKLYKPAARPGEVDRPRLLEKLSQGLAQGHRLSLISAPAGYGKTTLVVEWLQTLQRPSAWLSLERSDNHPVQFFTYLTAALQQISTSIGSAFQTALASADRKEDPNAWLQGQLPALVNEISAVEAPFVLVLDDFHAITDLGIHDALGYLLDHQPPQMHLALITRQDPLLRLSRQRSQGQVTEIRMGELRFTQEEASAFFKETMRLSLEPEQVSALTARTEGWIAGLQLAALSLAETQYDGESPHDPAQRAEFIRAFAGDDHHIMDYLMDEVLTRQPEAVQRFLLATSILKRLTGPLCDAVVGIQPGGDAPFSSQAILETLQKSNLFLIPLDNHRQWYRYHQLFAELLHARLISAQAEQMTGLHCRASQWYEAAGLTAEAIEHALLAEDIDRALRLIEHAAKTSIWSSGDLPVLLKWANRMPEEVVKARPRLCLYCARGLFFAGQIRLAEEYLRAAAQVLRAQHPEVASDPAVKELEGVLLTNQATFAAMCGETGRALELASRALPLVPVEDDSSQARVFHAIGMAEYLSGGVLRAEEAFSRALGLANAVNNRNLGLDVAACLALTLLMGGKARQAMRVCEMGLAGISASQPHPAASAIFIAQGEILYAQNELQAAQEALAKGIELGKQAGWAHVLWRGLAMFSAVKRAQGDLPGSQAALQQFEQIARNYHNPAVNGLVEAWKARLMLSLGDSDLPARWAERYPDLPPTEAFLEFRELTLARIWLAQGRTVEALVLLDAWLENAGREGRGHSLIEIQVLRSIALQARGSLPEALAALSQALELAEPEGFARLFLDRLEPLVDLLRQVRRDRLSPAIHRYADRLLAASDLPASQAPAFAPGPAGALVEPLSERETEVLRLVAEGLSNPQIAEKLFLSVNTLRAHTLHIFQKLDVHNRVQAAARARELGLI